MPNKEKVEGKCNARVKNIPEDWDVTEAYCANRAGFKTDHVGDGRCYLHGGMSTGPPKGSNNAQTHGLYADRQNYYSNLSEQEQNWVDAVQKSLVEDAPFDEGSFAKYQMVRNIAIDMHKMRSANDYVDEKGVIHRDKTTGYTDDGRPMKEDVENPVNIAYDRLNRTMTRQLKELGILDDPDSQQADAQSSIAEELSRLRQERSN